MSIKKLGLIFFLFFNHSLMAETECLKAKNFKGQDLRSEMPPHRDQDSIGWCYAFTAADLLTHYLYKTNAKNLTKANKNANYQSLKESVSAIALSTEFNRQKKANFYSGIDARNSAELFKKYKKKSVPESGSVFEALNIAKNKNLCFEKDMPSENFGLVKDARCLYQNKCSLHNMLDIIYDAPSLSGPCQNTDALLKMFPLLKQNTIKEIIKISSNQEALYRLEEASCQNEFASHFIDKDQVEIKGKSLGHPVNNPATKEDLIKEIDQTLAKGTPVGIAYYADFLIKEDKGEKKYIHASSIVGKRLNEKNCEEEYIVRDSYGSTCALYNRENPGHASCVSEAKRTIKNAVELYKQTIKCGPQFPPLPRNPRIHCDPASNYLFIRKADLANKILDITYIEEK